MDLLSQMSTTFSFTENYQIQPHRKGFLISFFRHCLYSSQIQEFILLDYSSKHCHEINVQISYSVPYHEISDQFSIKTVMGKHSAYFRLFGIFSLIYNQQSAKTYQNKIIAKNYRPT